jgi:hypothetical protein
MYRFEDYRPDILRTESGGDYNALFGYQNRPGGRFENVRVTDMTIGDILDFQNPRGAYGQYVAGARPDRERGVATPVGAYQIVGTTLRDAVRALNLPLDTTFTPDVQDRVARYIFETQGPQAWQGLNTNETAGQNVARATMAALGRGDAMNGQPTPSGLLAQGAAPERPRRDIGNILDQLAIGFSGMSLRPNQGIVQMAQQRIGQRREEQQTQQERNATLEWLAQSGLPNAEILIGGVQAGAITPADAARTGFQLLRTQSEAASDPNVQSSTTLPDMSGVVTVMRDGSVRVTTAGGETLSGQAAQDFVTASQENAARVARDLYAGRRTGTLEADVALGGTAAATTAAGQAQIDRANEAFDQAAGVQSNISNINDAIAAIDAGARSGLVENFFPSITEASASLENAMNRMGLDVIGSVTFGALSEGEMRLAMETAVPRNLDPAQLRDYLVRKREAQIKARDALMRAANYLARPGNTLDGWFAQRQQEMTGDTPSAQPGGTRMRFDAEGNMIND